MVFFGVNGTNFHDELLNRCDVCSVVLRMRAHKADKHQPLVVTRQHHQPVVIALDVEDNTATADKTGRPVCTLDLVRGLPVGTAGQRVPSC